MEETRVEYSLAAREIDILHALWKAEKPLLASEIVQADPNLKLPTVHTALKRMLEKNIVEVTDFVKSGNVYGRRYAPTLSLKEFELNQLSINTSNLVASMPNDANDEFILKELDNLERIIKQQRDEILKRRET